jgi:glycosyltransferase involved in cell wall biosynthesis
MTVDSPEQPVAVVIPARNEASTVAGVVTAARHSQGVARVLVVANDCVDSTETRAKLAGAEVLVCPRPGKGEAICAGLAQLGKSWPIVVFLDADLRNLTPDDIRQLVEPVHSGDFDMACGILAGRFWRRALHNTPVLRRCPTLSGQRAIRSSLLLEIPQQEMRGYNFEAVVNRHCKTHGLRVTRRPLNLVQHVRREEKGPPARAKAAKYRMIIGVYCTYARLIVQHRVHRHGRS